jgi:hypothetical protein
VVVVVVVAGDTGMLKLLGAFGESKNDMTEYEVM